MISNACYIYGVSPAEILRRLLRGQVQMGQKYDGKERVCFRLNPLFAPVLHGFKSARLTTHLARFVSDGNRHRNRDFDRVSRSCAHAPSDRTYFLK